MKTVPEPDAEPLDAEGVLGDVRSLSESLQQRQAERRAYAILNRPAVRSMLNTLVAIASRREKREERYVG